MSENTVYVLILPWNIEDHGRNAIRFFIDCLFISELRSFGMLEMEYSGVGVNTISADALVLNGARTVYDRQHAGLLHCDSRLLLNKVQHMIRNVDTYLMIIKTIQHGKSCDVYLVSGDNAGWR